MEEEQRERGNRGETEKARQAEGKKVGEIIREKRKEKRSKRRVKKRENEMQRMNKIDGKKKRDR